MTYPSSVRCRRRISVHTGVKYVRLKYSVLVPRTRTPYLVKNDRPIHNNMTATFVEESKVSWACGLIAEKDGHCSMHVRTSSSKVQSQRKRVLEMDNDELRAYYLMPDLRATKNSGRLYASY